MYLYKHGYWGHTSCGAHVLQRSVLKVKTMEAQHEGMKLKRRSESGGLVYVLVATGMLVVSIFVSIAFIPHS